MSCSHTKGLSYYQMYWYRQLPGETMELIVFTTTSTKNHYFGKFSKEKFSATKPDAVSGTFTVNDLVPDDKGLYFCAVYEHSDTDTSAQLTGPELIVEALNSVNMTFMVFILCFLHLPGHKSETYNTISDSASETNRVLQTPAFIIRRTGQSVLSGINCSHKIPNYQNILWYKQDQHKALKLLGYLNVNSPKPEDDVKGKISFDGDGRSHSSLTISDLVLNDTGYTDADDVTQTDMLWVKKGNNATMSCSHTKGATYYQMYWYRQLPGETMELIVFTTTTNKNHDFGKFSKEKFSATKPDAVSGTFTVNNLVPDDKGLYFCAVTAELTGPELIVEALNSVNMIFMVFILCFLHLPGHKSETYNTISDSASETNRVLQTPAFIIKRTSQSVLSGINCSHKITDYNVILWYKQDQHKALKLLGYLNVASPKPEDDVKGKISFDGDGRSHSSLTISDLVLNDTGYTDADDVTQTDMLWVKKGNNATMSCSHTKGATYYQMYWYRQLPGETMKLVVFTTQNKLDFEPDFRDGRFSATKSDAVSGTFTVNDLVPDDKGLYFCAVYLSVTESTRLQLKFTANKDNKPKSDAHTVLTPIIKSSGSSLSDQVHQTPAEIYNKPGERGRISCSHSIDSYNRILWYKQKEDGQMQLLGYMFMNDGYSEDGVNVMMEGSANKDKTCTLTTEELSMNSSAVYFCAASYTVLQFTAAQYKNLLMSVLQLTASHVFSQEVHLSVTKSTRLQLKFTIKQEKEPESAAHTVLTAITESSGSSLSDQVHQTPAEIYNKPGERAKISCSHSIDSYNRILWYKQTNGQLQFLGYMNVNTGLPEKGVNVMIEGSANKDKTCTLTTEELSVNSSAVYFCAASYTVLQFTAPQYKNLLTFFISVSLLTESCTWNKPVYPKLVFVHCQDVIQHPEISWSYLKKTAEMNCSHTKDMSHSQMYWYRQRPGETMTLIVYTALGVQPDYGRAPETKYSAKKEKVESGALTVNDLQPEDSGVCLSVQVHQTPPALLRRPGDKVQLVCSHEKTDYYLMYWYQKSPGDRALKRIGHVYHSSIEHEESFKEHFKIIGDMSGSTAKNGSLLILDLKAPEHSACLGVEVRQSASDLITKPGDKVQIFCTHDKTDYRTMLWYQQSPGDTAMKLIGYLNYKAVTMETLYEADFNITGDLSVNTAKNGSLITRVTRPEQAVYYCAARYAKTHSHIFSKRSEASLVGVKDYEILYFIDSCACLGVEVRQSASDLITKPGDKVQIFCTHDKTDYRVMLWYQQSPGDTAMKLIGYLYFKAVTMENLYEKQFNISGDLVACLGVEVRQSASDLITKPGDKVQIFCTHDKTDYWTMLWYQQSPGDTAMKLIGYLYHKAVTMETLYEADFNITGDLSGSTAKNGSLILKRVEHSAVYYCAAREAR
ncbi:Immunoglobulin lambda variable 2-18 [Collichthys lucidus]|nr:Immunoglobulin lambda variable 2-18 [Collichthys lucidus]